MKRGVALLLLPIFVAACARKAEPARSVGRPLHRVDDKRPDDDAERSSVVSIATGAVVTKRTGEILLENSAIRAIDGDPLSYWMAPPNDFPQSMTIALPARTRITRVGVRTDEGFPFNHLTVERSLDGASFEPLTTIIGKATIDPLWFDVASSDASYLRVTFVDQPASGRQVALRSVMFAGSELEPPHGGDIAGCWSINGMNARFERNDQAVTGTLALGNQPIQFAGGFDGRLYRLNWIRGNDYGYALITVAPDGRNLSAIAWHEEAIPLFYGDSWYGEKSTCASLPVAADVRERFLRRASRYSLFELNDPATGREALRWLAHFASANSVQLVAHEFRYKTAQENREKAKQQIDSILAELHRLGVKDGAVTSVVKGSDDPRQKPESDAARALYSTVDVEIRR